MSAESIRYLNDSYVDPSKVLNATYSSSDPSFPIANVYNLNRRTKVWRTKGYWDIQSGSNTLVFQETAASNLTATIAAAKYTTTALFLAAVKSALEATGDSTYTVTQDTTTKKIKIVSNGGGGGGIFRLILTDSLSAAMAETLGYNPSSDLTGSLIYVAEELRIHSYEFLKWDFGISSNPTALVLLFPRNTSNKFTPESVIKIQGNETDVWDNPSFSQTISFDTNTLALFSSEGFHTEPVRYWRLYLEDKSNPLNYLEIGCVYLGDFITTSVGTPQFPFTKNFIDNSVTSYSESGASFSDIRQKCETFEFSYLGLSLEEKESFDDLFETFGITNPFIASFDPNEVIGTKENLQVKLVKLTSAPDFELISPGNYTARIQVREEL